MVKKVNKNDLDLMENRMENYGKANRIVALLCVIFLFVNSVIVSESALNQLAANKYLAYILNFLAGCEGKLGAIGAMSNAKVFGAGEWHRLVLHIYLHAGVFHMLFNVFALLVAGKVVEKKTGSWLYLILYHLIAAVNAILMCLIFPDSTSVGASAGIFGMVGILCVMKWKKDAVCDESLKKGEWLYIMVFSIVSLMFGLESFVTHLFAFVFGIIAGLLLEKKM